MTYLTVLQFLSIWIGVISFVGEPPAGDKDNKDYGQWQDARTSDGVNTYFRWIMSSEGIRFMERRGEMDIQCTFHDAVKILSDAQHTSKWMAGIEESRTLGHPAKNEWYTYTVFSIPWPFNKRDLVSLNRISNDPDKGITYIDVACREKYLPVKPEVIRLTDYKAQWKIVNINESKIHLTFIAESSTPPAFPRYIQDPLIEKLFHNNLVRLKNLLEAN